MRDWNWDWGCGRIVWKMRFFVLECGWIALCSIRRGVEPTALELFYGFVSKTSSLVHQRLFQQWYGYGSTRKTKQRKGQVTAGLPNQSRFEMMKTRVHLGDHRMEVEPYNGFPVTGSWDGMGSNLTSMMTGMGNYFILAILLFRLIFSVELYGIAALLLCLMLFWIRFRQCWIGFEDLDSVLELRRHESTDQM